MKFHEEIILSKSDAIDICLGIGEKFIRRYTGCIASGSGASERAADEMQAWWDKARRIKLLETERPLTDINLIDWFFTAGGAVEDYMSGDNVERYNRFVRRILSNRETPLKNIISVR